MKNKQAPKVGLAAYKPGDRIGKLEFNGKKYIEGKVLLISDPKKYIGRGDGYYFEVEFQTPKGMYRVYCRKKCKIKKIYQFTWRDLAQRELLKKNLQGAAADVLHYDFCKGDYYQILKIANYFPTPERKIRFLNWALKQYYSSPEYVLHDEIIKIKRRREAEEFLADPEGFKKQYTRRIVEELEAPYEMLYFEAEECDSTPWVLIEREVKRLNDELSGDGKPNKRGPRDPRFSNLRPYHSESQKYMGLTSLVALINISRNTLSNWYKSGLPIHEDFKIEDWETIPGYETAPKSRRLLLKITPNRKGVIKKDLINFLEFTGQIEKEIIPPQNPTKHSRV